MTTARPVTLDLSRMTPTAASCSQTPAFAVPQPQAVHASHPPLQPACCPAAAPPPVSAWSPAVPLLWQAALSAAAAQQRGNECKLRAVLRVGIKVCMTGQHLWVGPHRSSGILRQWHFEIKQDDKMMRISKRIATDDTQENSHKNRKEKKIKI